MPFLPDVVQIGPLPLSMMALTALAGGVLAYLLIPLSAAHTGADPDVARDAVLNLFIGGVVGAKLLYVLLDLPGHLSNPAMFAVFPFGPKALAAAAAGGAAAVAWGLRRRADRKATLDAAAAPLALGLALTTAGWQAPGTWSFLPLMGAAGVAALVLNRTPGAPGLRAARTVLLMAGSLVVADLARPVASSLPGGITWLQLSAAAVGTLAWLWSERHEKAPTS